MTLEMLHLIQNKNNKRQYLTAVRVMAGDCQDNLDARAEATAERLEKRFGGWVEIRTEAEIINSNVNYPKDADGDLIFNVIENFYYLDNEDLRKEEINHPLTKIES